MSTILYTGVTGIVGSELASLLSSKGHQLICLVRGKKPAIAGAVNWQGDITKPLCGVDESRVQAWRGRIQKVIHCAASVKFDEKDAEVAGRTNVGGTKNLLALAERLEIQEIHHVSTAYVAGDACRFGENDVDIGQNCRNVYESTKLQAEKIVMSRPVKDYSIYRLGIIVGDSKGGRILAFNGYYGFLATVWHLRKVFEKASDTDREKYKQDGICFDSDGILNLPLWGNFAERSTLNIVPVDWVAEMLSLLVEVSPSGKIFHVVHPDPPRIRWTNDVSLRYLGVKGFGYQAPSMTNSKPILAKLQKVFTRGTALYLPYITHEPRFETGNIQRMLGRNCDPPKITESFLGTILAYAKSVNFGRKATG